MPLEYRKLDLRLYVITDRRLSRGRSSLEVVERAIQGGATCIQLREKDLSGKELYKLARQLRILTRAKGVTFIVNDRVDVALAASADGVHLGQDDLPAEAARRIMPAGMILGVSVENEEQAVRAYRAGASYLGAGAVFTTSTKADAGEPIGLEVIARICQSTPLPVVGIGGINAANAGRVIEAGAQGVAVVSAVVAAGDIAGAAGELLLRVNEALALRQGRGSSCLREKEKR